MSKIKILSSSIGYNLAAFEYDKKEKYLNSFEKNNFLPLLGDIKNKKILDVGAGTGRLSVMLSKAGAVVTALDVSGEMLNILSKKDHKIETVIGEAESLPFGESTFDVVTAAFLVVHLKNPKFFMDEAYRVLKDGGLLVFSNINQKEAPEVKTKQGIIKIESFYHRPEKILEDLEDLAYTIKNNLIIKEGETWVNQIIVAQK